MFIPKTLRDELRLEAGDALSLESEGERVTLRPVRSASSLRRDRVSGYSEAARDSLRRPQIKSCGPCGNSATATKVDHAHVGVPARVSTHDQQTLAMQNRAMREYAARRGWTIAVQIGEVGSGAAQREPRGSLRDAARRREIDVVLLWRLD